MILRPILVAGLALAATGVHAQSAFPPALDDPYYSAALPRSGAYFDAEHPGTGMFVDMREDGSVFVNFAVYDSEGKPTWYAVQDRFDPSYAFSLSGDRPFFSAWHASNSIGNVSAPLYRTSGGSCLGCQYTPPVIEEATEMGPVSIVWTNTGNAIVTVDGHASNWMRLPLDGVDTDIVPGRWRMQASFGLDLDGEARCEGRDCDAWFDSIVEVKPIAPLALEIDPFVADGAGPRAPERITHWFLIECVERCERLPGASEAAVPQTLWTDQPDLGGPDGDLDVLFWVDANTGMAGIDQLVSNDQHTNWVTGRRYSFSVHPGEDHWMARRAFTPGGVYPLGGWRTARPLDGSLIRMSKIED